MGGRQFLLLVALVDLELLQPTHPLQGLEALDRHFRRAGDEHDEVGLLLSVEGVKHFPEPDDLGTVLGVVVVLGVLLEVHD